MTDKKIDYKSAGVDIDAGNAAVDLIKDKVKTNILNVLLTERGERLYMPNFGCGLKNLLFSRWNP